MNTFFFDDVQYPEGLFGGKDFFNPIIYSTEEREVGVWIDNKPLYAKTYVIDSIPSNSYNYYTFASDIDKVINYQGMVIDSNGTSMNICYIRPDNANAQFYTQVLADKRFFFRTYIAWTASAYVTFYYTKTTDVAGSGSYNTLGVPMVHYTTDEQVIGTYLGETLYRKVFDFSNNPITVPTDTWLKVVDTWQIQPIRGTVIIPSSRASFDVAVDCDENDGLYIRGWLGYTNVTRLIVEYTKTS